MMLENSDTHSFEGNKNDPPVGKNLETPEDFRIFADATFMMVQALHEKLESKELYTHGVYEERSGSGRQFNIDTLWWKGDMPTMSRDVEQSLILVGTDTVSGKVAGIRRVRMDIIPKPEGDTIEAEGEIETRFRGIGAATAIDTAFTKVLAKIAEERNQPVIWKVFNAHFQRMQWNRDDAEILGLDATEREKLAQETKIREIEQQRWQNLYGEGGKLGLTLRPGSTLSYEKIFKPEMANLSVEPQLLPETQYEEILQKLEESKS